MSKKSTKLFDIAKKVRRWSNRLSNFMQYRLLVNAKHLLIIGGEGTLLKQEVIKNFNDTWRIVNIDNKKNDECELNLEIFENQQITEEKIQELSEHIQKFSKTYECILCLPNANEKTGDISSEQIFDQYDNFNYNVIQPQLLAAHLASNYLTQHGIVLFKGDQKSHDFPLPEQPAYSVAMNQINQLNLIIGEREDINIDAFSYCLLERDTSLDVAEKPVFTNNNNTEDSDKKNVEIYENEQLIDEAKQQAEVIRTWAEGDKKPFSGAYVKWSREGKYVFPQLH